MRADRLLSLLLLLQTRGRMTAQALAEHLEVSERTIYRDIESLSMAGIPLYTERGPGGGCELLDGYQTRLTGLTAAEVRTLFLLSISSPLADLGLNQSLEDALLKLSAALPATSREHAEQARQRIHIDTTRPAHSRQTHSHLELIQEALWQDCTLQLTYRYSRRDINPYGLVSKAGIWYLIGASAGAMQVVRVAHIQTIELSEQHFTRPTGFDLAAYWAEHISLTNHASAASRNNQPLKKEKIKVNLSSSTPQRGVYTTRIHNKKKTSHLQSTQTHFISGPSKKTQNVIIYSLATPSWNTAPAAA